MGGPRVDHRVVFKILCCDDDCGKFLGFRGENKRKCQEDLKVDIKVSVKRSTPHSAKVRCISISTPDNRDGAIRAIERVVRLMTEHKPPGLAQIRLILSDYQAQAVLEMAHALFHDCGVSVYEVRMAEASFILHHTERVLEVLASPVHLQDAVSACGSVAWDCGERMLPIPEDMAPAGPLPSFHHPEAVRANTGNLGEKVSHTNATAPTMLVAVAGGPPQPPPLQDVSPASSDTALTAAAFVPCQLRFRLVVPQDLVMQLMSKRGAAVCRLQAIREEVKPRGCSIQLHDRPKDQPKTSLRCLEITGSFSVPGAKLQAPAVYAARQICSQLHASPAGGQPVSIILALPKSEGQGGAIIGRGGEIINGIRETSRASVRVIHQLPGVTGTDVPAGVDVRGDEFVVIEGSPAAAQAALQSVLTRLTEFQERHGRDGSPDTVGTKRPRSDDSVNNSPTVDSRSKRHCLHAPRKSGSPRSSNPSPRRPLRASECAVLKQALVTNKQKNALMECKAGGVPPLEAVRRQLANQSLPVHIKLDDERREDHLRRLEIGALDTQTVLDATNYLNCLLQTCGQDSLPQLADVRAK